MAIADGGARPAFLDALDERLPLRTPAALQADANLMAKRQYAEVQRIGTDFFVNLGSILETKFSQGLEQHIGPLAAAIEKLSGKLANQNEDAMQGMLSAFLERLEGAIGSSMRDTAATLQTLGERLGGLQSGMDAAAQRMGRAEHSRRRRGYGAPDGRQQRCTDRCGCRLPASHGGRGGRQCKPPRRAYYCFVGADAAPGRGSASRRCYDVRRVLWRSADAKLALFDTAVGPKRVARHLVAGPETVPETLRQIGMDDPLRATGGFFRAAVAQLVGELPQSLNGRTAATAWDRSAGLLEVTRPERDRRGKEIMKPALRFPDMGGDVARASLSPWLIGQSTSAAPRETIKAFLLRTLGDPRLQPQRWAGAGDAAMRLMRSWLAAASLEAFLSLITQSNDDQQWRYRQAFWRACLKKIPNAEVWVVLGSALSGRAGAIRDLNGSFGTFAGSTASGDQAAFLMRLGDLILSEWSNVGAVRAWAVDAKHCPALYREAYQGVELKAPSLDFPNHPTRGNGGSCGGKGLYHHSSSSGLWQGCAAALLRNRLGVTLSPSDYMP